MRKKKPRVATLEEVVITRDAEYAIIEFRDPTISTMHLKLGPEVALMSDTEILERFNATVRAMEERREAYEHVAIEVPPGKSQVRYFKAGDQWVPRGDVLRCVIEDGGEGGSPVIHIDDHEFTWTEFGKMLCTNAGWGMRIIFVPDDETDRAPQIVVKDPPDETWN